MMNRKFQLMLLVLLICLLVAGGFNTILADDEKVFILPIKGTIDPGLVKFLERGIAEAQSKGAKTIILEINTPGGRIDSAVKISKLIFDLNIPVISYVNKEATSAGVLIAVSSEKIYMAQGATIGAAEPRPKEEKYISYWAAKLRATAEKTGRNPKIVAAMADSDISIPGVIEKGKILSLTSDEAVKLNIADKIVNTRAELFKELSVTAEDVAEIRPTFAENLARFVTNPFFSPVLLSIGFAGLILEVFTPGWGIPGVIGLGAFALFFGGHMIAGLAGLETVVLFLLGIVSLLIEVFVPGFGIFGMLGIIGVIGSVIAASISLKQGLISITISFIVSIVLIVYLFKNLSRSKFFDRIILTLTQEKTKGYKVGVGELKGLEGKRGLTLTPLKPTGSADIEGRRYDVISEGGFIDASRNIRIVKVEGHKIFVREENN